MRFELRGGVLTAFLDDQSVHPLRQTSPHTWDAAGKLSMFPATPSPGPGTGGSDTVPSDATGTGADAARWAASWAGRIPYVLGSKCFEEAGNLDPTTDPPSRLPGSLRTDCIGLVWSACYHVGLIVPYMVLGFRGDTSMKEILTKEELLPGDGVYFKDYNRDTGEWVEEHHIAMYIGNGQVVEACNPDLGVIINPLERWGSKFSYARRPNYK